MQPDIDDVEEGQVYQGVIEQLSLPHGVFVSIGNFYFAHVPVAEWQWPDCWKELTIGTEVEVMIYKARDLHAS